MGVQGEESETFKNSVGKREEVGRGSRGGSAGRGKVS